MFLASFAAVMGPMNYIYHLLSTPRLPFTTAYFGSITLTLVFALKVGSKLSCRFTYADISIAPQHTSYLVFCPYSACMSGVVLDQLLSYGLYWPTFCYIIRGEAGHSLDDWVEDGFAFEEQPLSGSAVLLNLFSYYCSIASFLFPMYNSCNLCTISSKCHKSV